MLCSGVVWHRLRVRSSHCHISLCRVATGKATMPADPRQLAGCRDTQWHRGFTALPHYEVGKESDPVSPTCKASWLKVCRDILGHGSHMALTPAGPKLSRMPQTVHGSQASLCSVSWA